MKLTEHRYAGCVVKIPKRADRVCRSGRMEGKRDVAQSTARIGGARGTATGDDRHAHVVHVKAHQLVHVERTTRAAGRCQYETRALGIVSACERV